MFFSWTSRGVGCCLRPMQATIGTFIFKLRPPLTVDTLGPLRPCLHSKQYVDELLPGAAWVNFADSEHGWPYYENKPVRRSTWDACGRPRRREHLARIAATAIRRTCSLCERNRWLDGWQLCERCLPQPRWRKHLGGVDLQGPSLSVLTLAVYGQIKIIDAKHALIPVGFSPVTDQSHCTLVLFTTADGENWKADRVLSMLQQVWRGGVDCSAG